MSADEDIIQIDVSRFNEAIQSMNAAAATLDETMAVAAEFLVSEVNDFWMSAGNGTWAPLAASTIKSRRGTIAQILNDTGRAAASVRPYSGSDFAEAASDVDYLKYHCGDGPRTRVPKRDPFDIPEDKANLVTEYILADFVARWADTGKTG